MAEKLSGTRHVIACGEPGFPEALTLVPSPPKRLYVIGNPEALVEGLAIIGARNATPYGRNAARLFAGIAARHGVPIISGGARGCDAEAHKMALEVGGRTVVFLGGGCDCVYPVENIGLFQHVIDSGGAVVSENPWTFPAQPYTFRARNRLIAGLARAVLIVEAGLPSGTFSTADEALAAGKEVMVVPGSIMSPNSRGANRLLLEGAWPVVDEQSFLKVLESLFGVSDIDTVQPSLPLHAAMRDDEPNPIKRLVYAAVCASPMRLDEIISYCARIDSSHGETAVQLTVVQAMKLVSELELQGKITRYPDGRFGALR